MSTHGFLCFTNIEKEEMLNSEDIKEIGELLTDEVKIYKHWDGYDIGTFLSDFLKDEALRRDVPENLTAWALYELMNSQDLSGFKNQKSGYYLTTHDEFEGWDMDYLFVVVKGEEVLLYKYGELKGIYTLNNLEDLKSIE